MSHGFFDLAALGQVVVDRFARTDRLADVRSPL